MKNDKKDIVKELNNEKIEKSYNKIGELEKRNEKEKKKKYELFNAKNVYCSNQEEFGDFKLRLSSQMKEKVKREGNHLKKKKYEYKNKHNLNLRNLNSLNPKNEMNDKSSKSLSDKNSNFSWNYTNIKSSEFSNQSKLKEKSKHTKLNHLNSVKIESGDEAIHKLNMIVLIDREIDELNNLLHRLYKEQKLKKLVKKDEFRGLKKEGLYY